MIGGGVTNFLSLSIPQKRQIVKIETVCSVTFTKTYQLLSNTASLI